MESIILRRVTVLWPSLFEPTKLAPEDTPRYRAGLVLPFGFIAPFWMEVKDCGNRYGLPEGTLVLNISSLKSFPVFGVDAEAISSLARTNQRVDSILHGHPADVIVVPSKGHRDRVFSNVVAMDFRYGVGAAKTFDDFLKSHEAQGERP